MFDSFHPENNIKCLKRNILQFIKVNLNANGNIENHNILPLISLSFYLNFFFAFHLEVLQHQSYRVHHFKCDLD